MRTCLWLALILLAAASIAYRWPGRHETAPDAHLAGWRRTVHGWEQTSHWDLRPGDFNPCLHPATALSLALFASLGGLFAFSPPSNAGAGRLPPPAWHVSPRRRSIAIGARAET